MNHVFQIAHIALIGWRFTPQEEEINSSYRERESLQNSRVCTAHRTVCTANRLIHYTCNLNGFSWNEIRKARDFHQWDSKSRTASQASSSSSTPLCRTLEFLLSTTSILVYHLLATFFVLFCFFSRAQSSKTNIQTMSTTHATSPCSALCATHLDHSYMFLSPPLLHRKVFTNKYRKQSGSLQPPWNLKHLHRRIKNQKHWDSSVIHLKNRGVFW